MESKKRRILIVDDDELNSSALGKRLERRGFDLFLVHDPEQVIETLATDKIELVLLDIVMPKKDGISVLKEVRQRFEKNELPIIMATSMNDSFDVVEAFNLGANDYITKPINVDVAFARINAHLSIVDLHTEGMKKQEVEAINAMITTYNHELNNPLTVALSLVGEPLLKDEEKGEKLRNALNRIADIVKKIDEIREKREIDYEKYAGNSKMIKVK